MERLYRGFDIITNRVHTSNQQRRFFPSSLIFSCFLYSFQARVRLTACCQIAKLACA